MDDDEGFRGVGDHFNGVGVDDNVDDNNDDNNDDDIDDNCLGTPFGDMNDSLCDPFDESAPDQLSMSSEDTPTSPRAPRHQQQESLSHHLGRLLMKSWLISCQMVVVARGSVASILMASTTRKYGTAAAH